MKLYYELEVDLTGLADNFKVGDESNHGFGLSNAFIWKEEIGEGMGFGR